MVVAMKRLPLAARGFGLTALAALTLPATALAQDEPTAADVALRVDTTWVIVATVLVFFMQAGFAFLEIGFSRAKNAGAGIAKIVVNFSIASIVWWAVGFAFAFGGAGTILGDQGWFFQVGTTVGGTVGDLYGGEASATSMSFFIFQFMFCAVSLAIVWGSTLERIKFAVYPLFAIVFAGFIYPLIAHWGFGGGLFAEIGPGVQDFAGSSVVHLTGATAAFAACLVLGPRRGKYGADGKPRAIPGHSVPLVGLGVLILWLGWFGFNGGSTLGAAGDRFAEVVMVTNLGAAGGILGAWLGTFFTKQNRDVALIANGGIAGLVAITAPSGYVEMWPAPIIGLIGGLIVVFGVIAIDKLIDDPIGATSAHGLAGIWGTLACGLFTSDRLAEAVGIGQGGLFYSGSFSQLGAQAAAVGLTFLVVFVISFVAFQVIKAILGGSLRVDADEEDAGLDIAEHGMYGYPEQFIPAPELIGYTPPPAEIAAELGRTGRAATATPGSVSA
jgi:ammonium transporter, Amt family